MSNNRVRAQLIFPVPPGVNVSEPALLQWMRENRITNALPWPEEAEAA